MSLRDLWRELRIAWHRKLAKIADHWLVEGDEVALHHIKRARELARQRSEAVLERLGCRKSARVYQ